MGRFFLYYLSRLDIGSRVIAYFILLFIFIYYDKRHNSIVRKYDGAF